MTSHIVVPPILLIVSEREEVRSTLAQTLRLYGVRNIQSVADTLAPVTAARIIPDVVIVVVDQYLDKAAKLVRELRNDIVTRHTPIVARVSSPSQSAIDTLLSAGAERVLPASTEPSALINTVIRLSDVPEPCRALRELRRSLAPMRLRAVDQRTDTSAIRVRAAQLAAALQAFPISMLAADPNGICLAANQAVSAVTGLTRDDIIGKRLWDVVLPGTGRDLRVSWQTFLAIGALNGACALRRRNGDGAAAQMYAAAFVLPDCHVAAIKTLA